MNEDLRRLLDSEQFATCQVPIWLDIPRAQREHFAQLHPTLIVTPRLGESVKVEATTVARALRAQDPGAGGKELADQYEFHAVDTGDTSLKVTCRAMRVRNASTPSHRELLGCLPEDLIQVEVCDMLLVPGEPDFLTPVDFNVLLPAQELLEAERLTVSQLDCTTTLRY
jgi:hypothetical protein